MVCTSVDQMVLVTSPADLVMGEIPAGDVDEATAVISLDDALSCSAPTVDVEDAGCTTVVERAQLDVE